MSTHVPLTYKDTGVDIGAKEGALERAKAAIRGTFGPAVLSDVGLFGGLFDPARAGAADAVLVASADGVGTKIAVARELGVFDSLGHDIVNHCVNDILVQGARPLFFLDYFAAGKLDPGVFAEVIRGLAEACRAHGMALLGGETAEMPGTYAAADFDLAGFIVGCVARDRILDGSRVQPGQTLIGVSSSGLHTNGYTLARRIVTERLGGKLGARPDELGGASLGEALLAPHRSYQELLWPLLDARRIQAMAHITGGGFPGNVNRILGKRVDAFVERRAWTPPGLFRLLVERGDVARDEAYRVFNMGIGMVLVVESGDVSAVQSHLQARGESAPLIGETRAGSGKVHYSS